MFTAGSKKAQQGSSPSVVDVGVRVGAVRVRSVIVGREAQVPSNVAAWVTAAGPARPDTREQEIQMVMSQVDNLLGMGNNNATTAAPQQQQPVDNPAHEAQRRLLLGIGSQVDGPSRNG